MVTLDGYFEGSNRELDWHLVDDEFNEYAREMLNSVDSLLFGRITYQLMAGYWPTATRNDPYITEKMNSLKKIVFSKTLSKVEWNNTQLVKSNIEQVVFTLKQQTGKNIALFGSATILALLMQNHLIDELRIVVNPVILASGKPLFKNLETRHHLELLNVKPFKSGNVLLQYRLI